MRVAWSGDLGFAVVEPEVAELARAAADDLVEAAGLTLVDRPVELEDYIATYARMEGVDQFVGIAPELWQDRLDELDPLVARLRSTSTVTPPAPARRGVEAALVRRGASACSRTRRAAHPDVLRAGVRREGPMPTEVAGVSGHAGMAVPTRCWPTWSTCPPSASRWADRGRLPIGLQVVARRFREDVCPRWRPSRSRRSRPLYRRQPVAGRPGARVQAPGSTRRSPERPPSPVPCASGGEGSSARSAYASRTATAPCWC
jgi:hypothetical protein